MFKQLIKVDNLANIESEVRKINLTSDNESFMSDDVFLENVCDKLRWRQEFLMKMNKLS